MNKKLMPLMLLFLMIVFACQREDMVDTVAIMEALEKSTCDSLTIVRPDFGTEAYTIVEDMPCFPACHESNSSEECCKSNSNSRPLFDFINANVVYPEEAVAAGIEGTVYIGFVISKHGCLYNIHIKQDNIGFGLGEEALRVIKTMPDWEPGYQRDVAVDVAYTLPFKFEL